jgi:ATP-dependent DNA helicase DinG
MPARECVGAARCPFGDECFAEASRARAREADIVVTNHSLLAVDMLAGRHIVPPHKLLIVDEAHELADRVSSAAQAELVPELIDRSTRQARTLRPETAERLTEAGDALAVGLAEAPAGRITGGLPAPLREACTLLDAATRAALDAIGDVKSDDPDPVRKQQAKAALDELSTTAQRLLEEGDHDVAWVEKSDNGGRRALVVAPLSVAGTLATHLYDERTVVATSATLALGGRFDTVARALGLDAPPPAPPSPAAAALARTTARSGRPAAAAPSDVTVPGPRTAAGTVPATEGPGWRSLDVGSPFDYARQGILYVAAHLPRPSCLRLPDAAGEDCWRWSARSVGVPSGSSRRGGPRSRRLSCAARGPTCPCCCRARSRCRCWSAGSARSGRPACSA